MSQLLAFSFNDAFKSSFVDQYGNNSVTLRQGLLIIAVSVALGLAVCAVYRMTYKGVLFSLNFCISLFAMEVITTFIILTVTSNIVLSLGMVGALSIVRFRTAVKDPMDIAYLYFSICVGIMCGAGLLWLAAIGVVIIGGILVVISFLPAAADAYILMVTVSSEDEDAVVKYVKKSTKKSKLKSKSLVGGMSELAIEVKLAGESTKFLNKLSVYPSISSITLVKSSGEYI